MCRYCNIKRGEEERSAVEESRRKLRNGRGRAEANRESRDTHDSGMHTLRIRRMPTVLAIRKDIRILRSVGVAMYAPKALDVSYRSVINSVDEAEDMKEQSEIIVIGLGSMRERRVDGRRTRCWVPSGSIREGAGNLRTIDMMRFHDPRTRGRIHRRYCHTLHNHDHDSFRKSDHLLTH